MQKFCTARRAESWRDWWVIAFAVDDSCDRAYSDGKFADSVISWSASNGPRVNVLLYNGYEQGPEYIDGIFMHEIVVIAGNCYREREPGDVITQVYDVPRRGLWTVTLRVWDVGGGQFGQADSTYFNASGVADRAEPPGTFALSPGRPNPGADLISWDLQVPSSGRVELCVVGIDGRVLTDLARQDIVRWHHEGHVGWV